MARRTNKPEVKTFEVNDVIRIDCLSERTRSGFRHLATLYYGGSVLAKAKVCYQNRTWEAYEFQSVLEEVARKTSKQLSDAENRLLAAYIAEDHTDWGGLRVIAAAAKMGEIFAETTADQNVWKARMLKAGLGDAIDLPTDWETLSEEEKQRRLDGAISVLR
jgi:hypothetical protein